MMSLQETRAAVIAAREVCDLPVMATLTFESDGRTLFGTPPECVPVTLQGLGADAVGLNCSAGPDRMKELTERFYAYSEIPVIVKPNAGIPELEGDRTVYRMTPEVFSESCLDLVRAGARIIGGCCGTTPEHIRALVRKLDGIKPLPVKTEKRRVLCSERKVTEIIPGESLKVIGERINPTGKKALQKELREGRLDLVRKMAREQEQAGAAILDVNCGTGGIDEKRTMTGVINELTLVTDLPLCIDSSFPEVLEAALRIYPGRALINSISCEARTFRNTSFFRKIPGRYHAFHSIVPLEHLRCLFSHNLNFSLTERNGPRKRAEGIGANVKRQQTPEFHGDLPIKVSVHHTGGESRRCLCTPHDPVKFLPWVTEIITVKVNDGQNAVLVDHHISNMVITMLVALRSVPKQMAVFFQIHQKFRSTVFVFQLTSFVQRNLPVYFGIEAIFPIRCIFRRRNRMDFSKDLSCVTAITVLRFLIHCHNSRFSIHSIDPA
jgi:hypothetical protein